MLISHSHSFAFFHVPKTAGSSVRVALGRHATCVDDYWANRALARIGIPVNRFAPWPYTKLRPHASAATLAAWVPPEIFERLFKFAFVRNPWDLLVSYWHYLRHNPGHHRRRIARRLPDFAAYVGYEIRRGRISQSRLLCDRRGRLLVDFVGRYESLPTDFVRICRRVGIEATPAAAATTATTATTTRPPSPPGWPKPSPPTWSGSTTASMTPCRPTSGGPPEPPPGRRKPARRGRLAGSADAATMT
jgi:hypothetical protein